MILTNILAKQEKEKDGYMNSFFMCMRLKFWWNGLASAYEYLAVHQTWCWKCSITLQITLIVVKLSRSRKENEEQEHDS